MSEQSTDTLDIELLLELLSGEDQSIVECTRISDRRVLVVERQIFHRARLCFGARDGIWDGGYETTYDYESPKSALIALQSVLREDREPDGWTRHFDTGRYRINGDKNLEWIKDNDQLNREKNIIRAIRSTEGNCLIDDVRENSLHVGSEMPAYTQCFTVASKGTVQWIVYRYCHRNVVLSVDEIETTSVGNVIERLKGGDE